MYQKLIEMLQASLQPDPNIRHQAEAYIAEAKKQQGYMPTLLEISSASDD